MRYRWKDGNGEEIWKYVIFKVGILSILREYYDGRMVGYFGVEKILARFRMLFYFWFRMRDVVIDWCRDCEVCNRIKIDRGRGVVFL